MSNKPILAIISDDIRSDLNAPLKYFTKIKVIHFYRKARYQDMKKEEFANTICYKNFQDLYKKLENTKPDVIQGPEPYASRAALKNCWTVYRFHKKYETPYFFPMFENCPANQKFGLILAYVMEIILKKYASSAKMIINLNLGAQKNLLKIGVPENKIIHLNWGTWGVREEFRPNNIVKNKSNDSKIPVIVFIGRIEKPKGVYNLLDALKSIRIKYPKTILQFIGNGSLVDEIKKHQGVNYLGIIKNKDLPEYLQKAWVVSIPSISTRKWQEQVGSVNLEAMACGTPVVSTFSGAIPEYIPDKIAGILVPENDSQALADALLKIIDNKKLRVKLGNAAREYIEKYFIDKDNIKIAETFVLRILKNAKK